MIANDVREIDKALGGWVAARGGSELLGRAATASSHGEAQGHVRCALDADAGFSREEVECLRAHAWVGDGSAFTPFVFDAGAHLYTWRNWRNETRLAAMLRERAAARELPVDAATLAIDVAELFAGESVDATRWQRAAVAAVPGARVFVLSGGPGTGKTTTVLRMLLILLRHAQACGFSRQADVALAAPTGKAAQRLTEAIASGRMAMDGRLDLASAFAPALARLAAVQAQTLHRLLGYQPWSESFAFGPGSPLPADIVVVDEASMIDLAMMRRLFDALRPQATLILLGDPAQLYAIEAGSVLGDVVGSVAQNALPEILFARLSPVLGSAAPARENSIPLAGQVLTLTHSFRAQADLQAGLDALRDGNAAWSESLLGEPREGAVQWRSCVDATALRACIDEWIAVHSETYARIMRPDIEPGEALEALREVQILCALREGPFGAEGVNMFMTRLLAKRFGFDANAAWYPGRPVIVTRNDYARGLYNGDVGIALEGGEGLRVWFDAAGTAGPRRFSPRALPAHETAWAITIHRSQGSEYDHVAVLLPPDAQHRILSRELVYTAVSRARKGAQLWASADALRAAAAQPVVRRSGLRERLMVP